MKKTKSFSLIEILIASAIFSVVVLVVMSTIATLSSVQSGLKSATNVSSSNSYVLESISRDIAEADAVFTVGTETYNGFVLANATPDNITATPGGTIDGWYRDITINNNLVAGRLENIPILFNSNSDSNPDPTVRLKNRLIGGISNLKKIYFTDTNNQMLAHEIERYVPSTGILIAWIKLPVLDASTTNVIRIHYGGSDIAPDSAGEYIARRTSEVWDNSYSAVWHFKSPTSGKYLDSTQNHIDATSVSIGTAADTYETPLGTSGLFQNNAYANIDTNVDKLPYANSSRTICAWVKSAASNFTPPTESSNRGILSYGYYDPWITDDPGFFMLGRDMTRYTDWSFSQRGKNYIFGASRYAPDELDIWYWNPYYSLLGYYPYKDNTIDDTNQWQYICGTYDHDSSMARLFVGKNTSATIDERLLDKEGTCGNPDTYNYLDTNGNPIPTCDSVYGYTGKFSELDTKNPSQAGSNFIAFIGKDNPGNPSSPYTTWQGSMDEITVSNTARSEAWITTQYYNQTKLYNDFNNPSPDDHFFNIGSEQVFINGGGLGTLPQCATENGFCDEKDPANAKNGILLHVNGQYKFYFLSGNNAIYVRTLDSNASMDANVFNQLKASNKDAKITPDDMKVTEFKIIGVSSGPQPWAKISISVESKNFIKTNQTFQFETMATTRKKTWP